MLRSTKTTTGYDDDSQRARDYARVICGAFQMTQTQVAVVGGDRRLLCASSGLPTALAVSFDALGALSPSAPAALLGGIQSCLVAGVHQIVELDNQSDAEGPLRIECAPWDIPLEADLGGTEAPRASGLVQRVVLLVVRDDSELHAVRRRAEQINRVESLGMLAGSVAHDFNNLLTGIRGSLALVRHHVTAEGREQALTAADSAAQRAGEMTRRLLSFSRGPEHVKGRAEPSSVLQETVDLLRCMPDSTRVDTDIQDGLGAVDMLPSELHQVVLNLLINASDAVRSLGEASGVMLRADATWRAQPGGLRANSHWLRVSVIDRGPGMTTTVREHIFEPFFTTKPRGTGTGLGLSSVKEMVENAGGWLEVESEVDRGSAFHVYLPLTGQQAPPLMTETPVPEPTPEPAVLICDDEGRLGELTVGLLEEFGFSAQAVLRGEDALEVMAGPHPPAALLLDVNLSSGLSATEVIESIERRGWATPVILTSGMSVEDLPPSLRHHRRVVSYLGKPYTVNQLVSAITAALKLSAAPSGTDVPPVSGVR